MADDEVPLTSALLAGGFGYALATMTGLLTANGGAAALLMTLVGNAWSHSPADGRVLAQLLRWPIGSFALGIMFAIATAMLSYASQIKFIEVKYNERRFWEASYVFRRVACLSALLSLALFVIGCCWAVRSFA